MRHKWEKAYSRQKYFPYPDGASSIVVVNTQKCINCGLLKGTTRHLGMYPVSVYFNDDKKIISTHTIPYTCKGIKGGAYFDEDEFKII
jgi:hypothetical protein